MNISFEILKDILPPYFSKQNMFSATLTLSTIQLNFRFIHIRSVVMLHLDISSFHIIISSYLMN
jgi:hypothetical protein